MVNKCREFAFSCIPYRQPITKNRSSPYHMFQPIKYSSRSLTLLACYPVFAIGQIWLYRASERLPAMQDRLTTGATEWVNAHLILIVSLALIIKAYLAISDYLRPTRGGWMASLAVFLTAVSIFALLGKYTVNLVMVEVFRLPPNLAIQTMERIQGNAVISALFTGSSSLINILRIIELPMLANILLGAAFITSGKIPRWAVLVYIAAFLLSSFGMVLHPVYGMLIKNASYVLFSVAFLPVATGLWKKTAAVPAATASAVSSPASAASSVGNNPATPVAA